MLIGLLTINTWICNASISTPDNWWSLKATTKFWLTDKESAFNFEADLVISNLHWLEIVGQWFWICLIECVLNCNSKHHIPSFKGYFYFSDLNSHILWTVLIFSCLKTINPVPLKKNFTVLNIHCTRNLKRNEMPIHFYIQKTLNSFKLA